MAYCAKCFHRDVCKTCDSCDGQVPGCIQFTDRDALAKEVNDLREMIAELREKQAPKKPRFEGLADRLCPVCGAYIPFDALNDDVSEAPNFCDCCGQAFDWGDLNVRP